MAPRNRSDPSSWWEIFVIGFLKKALAIFFWKIRQIEANTHKDKQHFSSALEFKRPLFKSQANRSLSQRSERQHAPYSATQQTLPRALRVPKRRLHFKMPAICTLGEGGLYPSPTPTNIKKIWSILQLDYFEVTEEHNNFNS